MTENMYVPALRWRQGEYQALYRLAPPVKDRIVPFITIPEIEFDFEEQRPKKSVQEHVHPFVARYNAKWGKRSSWVGVHKNIAETPMNDGRSIFRYIFEALRTFEAQAIPWISLDVSPSTIQSICEIAARDSQGIAISVRLEDLMKSDPRKRIEAFAYSLGVSMSDVDIVIDLGAPNFEPCATFAAALIPALRRLGDLNIFRNFALIGTAIPETFRDIAKGSDAIQRMDWQFYRKLTTKLPKDVRRPNFGDYTIVHPNFTAFDMRLIKSAGKLVYATSENWEVRKGGSFRDNPKQMHEHCASIIRSGKFKGQDYSNGDDYIARCATHEAGPSNLTRWKEVGINHHITQVLDDLAKLVVAS